MKRLADWRIFMNEGGLHFQLSLLEQMNADGGITVAVMPGFHHSVAVLLLPFRRCRYENSVRIP